MLRGLNCQSINSTAVVQLLYLNVLCMTNMKHENYYYTIRNKFQINTLYVVMIVFKDYIIALNFRYIF